MAFKSLEQIKSMSFDSREALEKELKKNTYKVSTPTYRPEQTPSGSWIVQEIDPDASQEIYKPGPTTTKGRAATVPKPMPKPKPKDTVTTPAGEKVTVLHRDGNGIAVTGRKGNGEVILHPATAKAQPAPKPEPKKAAAKPAKPATAGRNKKDPSPDELPPGFDKWLLAEASGKNGILRADINKKIGSERRWMNYLTELGKKHGMKATMVREGRFTRFFLKKG